MFMLYGPFTVRRMLYGKVAVYLRVRRPLAKHKFLF